jgi:hypothetical protein
VTVHIKDVERAIGFQVLKDERGRVRLPVLTGSGSASAGGAVSNVILPFCSQKLLHQSENSWSAAVQFGFSGGLLCSFVMSRQDYLVYYSTMLE